jgi:Mn2+/Fe2+ NRAMP family transporter
VALLAANTISIAADLAGMADAAEMLSGINSHWFVVVFALLISWATVRLRYHHMANVLKWLVLVLFAYPITAFVVGADWGRVVRDTLVPSMPHTRDEWSTLVAILGTTISPYLFFWQASEEVEEEKAAGLNSLSQRRGATVKELQLRRMDVGVGTFFSNIVMFRNTNAQAQLEPFKVSCPVPCRSSVERLRIHRATLGDKRTTSLFTSL